MFSEENFPELYRLQRQLDELTGNARREYEAKKFAPKFVTYFKDLDILHEPPNLPDCELLISVVGFSPIPVAYMAARAKPRELFLLGSEDTLGKDARIAGQHVVDLICRISGLAASAVEKFVVEEHKEEDLYTQIRNRVRSMAPNDIRKVWIDPTGGKKSMSAAAALAAYREGVPVVYVDYHADGYDQADHRPKPGYEFPRYLLNPLELTGDEERDRIFAAFNRGDYRDAAHRARLLARFLGAPREAEALACIAEAYGRWEQGDYKEAAAQFRELAHILQRHDVRGEWPWATDFRRRVAGLPSHLDSLASVQEAASKEPESTDQGLIVADEFARAMWMQQRRTYFWCVLELAVCVERLCQNVLRTKHTIVALDPNCTTAKWDDVKEVYENWKGKDKKREPFRKPDFQPRIMLHWGVFLLAAHESGFWIEKGLGLPATCSSTSSMESSVCKEKEARERVSPIVGKLKALADLRNTLVHPGDGRRVDDGTAKKVDEYLDLVKSLLAVYQDDLDDTLLLLYALPELR